MAEQATRKSSTGRRKTATAQVRITPGSGVITVNKRSFEDYFVTEAQRGVVLQPLQLTANIDKIDVHVNVRGGGPNGQASAVRHGLSRALILSDATLRPALKQAGYLTRDSRMRERKKYGQPGARKRFQFSKR